MLKIIMLYKLINKYKPSKLFQLKLICKNGYSKKNAKNGNIQKAQSTK